MTFAPCERYAKILLSSNYASQYLTLYINKYLIAMRMYSFFVMYSLLYLRAATKSDVYLIVSGYTSVLWGLGPRAPCASLDILFSVLYAYIFPTYIFICDSYCRYFVKSSFNSTNNLLSSKFLHVLNKSLEL